MSRSFLFICAIALFSGCAQAQSLNIEAGPIWNQADANQKCPRIAARAKGAWTGQWWTTQPGKMSVCQVNIRNHTPGSASVATTPFATAMATANLNVRSGPGVGYAKIGALALHEPVTVTQCTQTRWCAVSFRGRTGWVSKRYRVLTPAKNAVQAGTVPQPIVVLEPPEPDVIIVEPEEPEIIVIEPDEPEIVVIEPDNPDVIIVDGEDEVFIVD